MVRILGGLLHHQKKKRQSCLVTEIRRSPKASILFLLSLPLQILRRVMIALDVEITAGGGLEI